MGDRAPAAARKGAKSGQQRLGKKAGKAAKARFGEAKPSGKKTATQLAVGSKKAAVPYRKRRK